MQTDLRGQINLVRYDSLVSYFFCIEFTQELLCSVVLKSA